MWFVIPMVSAFFGIPFSAVAAVGWFRRYQAVRHTGWHPASVLVMRRARANPLITVKYAAHGGDVLLRAATSTHGALRQGHRPQQAWVGGEAWAMVVLFPREEGKRLYAVPARAQAPRSVPLRTSRRARRR
jgi:hypothetical protein